MTDDVQVDINKGIASTASSVWLFAGGAVAHMARIKGWEFIILAIVASIIAYTISYVSEKAGVVIILIGVGLFIFGFYNSGPFHFSEIVDFK